jgi:hypothetical protein
MMAVGTIVQIPDYDKPMTYLRGIITANYEYRTGPDTYMKGVDVLLDNGISISWEADDVYVVRPDKRQMS